MRFSNAFLDMLIIKGQNGLSDDEAHRLGKLCKIDKGEMRFVIKQLKAAGLIERGWSMRKEEATRVWIIKKPKSAILAGVKNAAQ